MQVIKGTRTTNVHYIGILLQLYGAGKGWDLPLKSSNKMTCKTRLKSSRKH